MTATNICTDALLELNVINATDGPLPDDLSFVLGKLNRLIDNWNAERMAVYNAGFSDVTLIANHSPHTIGPAGDFVVTQRPVTLDAAQLNLGNHIFTPITVRDDEWYAAQPAPIITTSQPTDVYYSPDWPTGALYFYPVPTTAYSVRLWTRTVLAQLALTDTFSLPPGYQDAITLTLAEDIATPYGKPPQPELGRKAQEARARIFGNNVAIPHLVTQDAGLPGGRASGTYLTGWNMGRG